MKLVTRQRELFIKLNFKSDMYMTIDVAIAIDFLFGVFGDSSLETCGELPGDCRYLHVHRYSVTLFNRK